MNSEQRNKRERKWFEPVFNFETEISAKKVCLEPKEPKNDTIHTTVDLTKVEHDDNIKFTLSKNWIDNFAPVDISDLAVNNKKIDEVQTWMKNAFNNSACVNSILLITGPSGCGKTATVEILAKSLGVNLSEWVTPMDLESYRDRGENGSYSHYEKQSDKFYNFLMNSSCYPSLLNSYDVPRIVLVEDFPNFVLRDSTAFTEILQKYKHKGKSPLIFICSDNCSSLNIAWNLFPPNILEKFQIQHISFNPVANTNMKAAMKRVTTVMSKKYNSIYDVPNQENIDGIINSSMGDIRSAINNLHFTSLKSSCNIKLQQCEKGKKQKTNKKVKGKKAEKNLKLDGIGKDENISIMHGVGRVLNPKPISKVGNSIETFTHVPISIAEQFEAQPSSFIGFIFENYLPHFSDIHNVERASNFLSDADCLLNEWKLKDNKIYGLTVAIAGMMISNKSPVSSWHPIRGQKIIKTSLPTIKEFPLLDQDQLVNGEVFATDYKTYYEIIKDSCSKDVDDFCIEEIDDNF